MPCSQLQCTHQQSLNNYSYNFNTAYNTICRHIASDNETMRCKVNRRFRVNYRVITEHVT